MCALAVVFAGHGVAALQEAGRLPLEPVAFFELGWLGIHPDALGLAAQALVLLLVALFYGRDWWTSRQRAAQP
jgi:high-affinity iron transporter